MKKKEEIITAIKHLKIRFSKTDKKNGGERNRILKQIRGLSALLNKGGKNEKGGQVSNVEERERSIA